MDKITLLKRDRNYDSSKKGLNWLISSLLHSLRMTQNEYDEFEANQKLRKSNKIEIDNEVSLLDDYDVNNLFETLKNNLLDLINDTSTNPEDEKEKNYLRGLNKKLKDFSSESSNEITDFINLSIENKQFDENAYRELLTNNGVKRIQQRISLLSKYITLSGKVSDDKVKGFVNRVKEVILVIPSTNKIPTIDLYGDFTRTTLTNFYKDNFKDFNILFAVSHLDETTPHSHMFIDLKNKKTGKYDFAAKELEFAIKYSQNMPNFKKMPLLEDYKLKGRKESKQEYIYKKELNSWKAEIVQTAFFDYFNKKSLEADLGLNAEKLAPTKERNRRNRIIEEEAKKPKAERNFNYYTKQLEDMELKINILTKELNNSKEEKKEMTTKIIELKTKFDKGVSAVNNIKEKEKVLNSNIAAKDLEIKRKDLEIKNKDIVISNKDIEIDNIKKEKKELIESINNDIDLMYDEVIEKNDILINNTYNQLKPIMNAYKNIIIEIEAVKNSIPKIMNEFVAIMAKMKGVKSKFSKEYGDSKNGILDGVKSFISYSFRNKKNKINEIYEEACKTEQSNFKEFSYQALVLVEDTFIKNKNFEDIVDIQPVYDDVVKPVLLEKRTHINQDIIKIDKIDEIYDDLKIELAENFKEAFNKRKIKPQ